MKREKLAVLVAAIFGATLLSACDRPQSTADAAKERSTSTPESPRSGGMTADSSRSTAGSQPSMGAPSPSTPAPGAPAEEPKKDLETKK